MSSNEGTVVCPLCQSKVSLVGGGDALQLHYLTNCSGYDKVPSEPSRSKITSQTGSSSSSSAYLNTTGSASGVSSSAAAAAANPSLLTPGSASAAIGGSPSGADSVGATVGGPSETTCSVQFMWQPLSDIRYPSITLLASFKGGSVELKIDPDGGHYASRFTSIPKGTYEGQLVIGDSFMHPVKKFTIEKDDDIVVLQFEVADTGGRSGGDLDTGYGDHYGSGYMQRNPSYNQGSTRSSYSYTNPAFGHGNSSGQRGFANEGSSSAYGDRYGYSAFGQPTLDSASENARGSSQYSMPSTHPSSTVKSKNAEHHLSDTTNVSQHYNDINISPLSTSQSSGHGGSARSKDQDSGFSARQLRQERSEGAQDQQLRQVRAQLETITQEKNELLLNQERVNAQWEGRVRRLERQIEAYNKGEKPAESDTEASLRDAHITIAELERQMVALRRQKAEESQSARESQDLRKQLNEMKDRNTALEQQMMEYNRTVQDQDKLIQSLKGGGSSGDTAVMQQLLHKQQVEYSEAIATMRKRIDYADKVAQENTETHQTNIKLAGELEDYRSQTKRLIHDIQQKDEEMVALRQALAQRPSSTNEAMSLELATLKQKLSAWQKEVEKLAPFQQKMELVEGELAQMKTNNAEFYQQMQQLENEVEKSQHELAEKVSDYNTLSERFAELQQTRVNLENELQPLREERATILRENAHLLEGSDPKKYANLKKDHEALVSHCQQLEQALEEQSNLLSAHQESNVEMQQQLDKATDPERLQSIRTRMERYKQERDQARSRIEEAETQLAQHRSEHEMLKSKFQELNDQSQGLLVEMQQQLAQREKALHKSVEFEKRMRRYREERNQVNDHNRLLEQQIKTLQGAINDLLAQTGQDTANYLQSLTADFESMDMGGVEDTPEHQEPVPKDFLPGSPSADDYHPQLYSADEDQREHSSHKEWETESPLDQEARLQVGDDTADRELSYSSEVKGSLGGPKSNTRVVEVQTKDGIAHMNIQKPHTPLNAKEKPTVIVKKGDSYEIGTLMYVGIHGGKEIAGVHMNIRQSRPSGTTTFTDGTYNKDGKRYFKCPTGFGLYVPVSKIFVKSVGSDVI